MRFALCAIFASLLLALAAPACDTRTGPGEENLAGGCASDFDCPYGEECGAGTCQPLAPTIYTHIQTASALFRDYLDIPEIDWRAAHYDVAIGEVHTVADALRSVNPNMRVFEYLNIRYYRFDQPAGWVENWATQHGYDPEDFYLHYREDTAVPTWESRVLVEGFPAGVVPGWNPNAGPGDPPASAGTRAQSRAVSLNDGSGVLFYMVNIEDPGLRAMMVDYVTALLEGKLYGSVFMQPLSAIVSDNAIYYPQFRDGVLENTYRYYGLPYTDDHPYARGFETIYPELAAGLAARLGYCVDVMPNYSHAYYLNLDNPSSINIQKSTPWGWAEVWLMYHGWSSPTQGSTRCITWERDYENAIAAIARETRRGSRRLLGARDKPLTGGGAGSDRGRIFLLALYYLVHNRNTYFVYETVNGHAGGTHLSEWSWDPAVEFDIGQPDQIPPGKVDFDGNRGTTEHYIFAEGPDPYDTSLTYRVLARRFTNALVLARMLPDGSVVTDESKVDLILDGSYMPLQADGTLGPVVTTISLRNNEGAILIPVN